MQTLRVLARYDAKIIPPLHVSLNSSVTRQSFKNLSENFLTKWSGMSKVSFNFSSATGSHFSNVTII